MNERLGPLSLVAVAVVVVVARKMWSFPSHASWILDEKTLNAAVLEASTFIQMNVRSQVSFMMAAK